ncbi:hypothetical protein [Streptomyces sp. Ac-502]
MIAHVHRAKGARAIGASRVGDVGPFGPYPDPDQVEEDDDQAAEEPPQ